MSLPKLPGPGESLTLDPSNPEHQALAKLLIESQSAPIARPADTLSLERTPMQKVMTVSDLENIRAAEKKRARKAAKL